MPRAPILPTDTFRELATRCDGLALECPGCPRSVRLPLRYLATHFDLRPDAAAGDVVGRLRCTACQARIPLGRVRAWRTTDDQPP